MKFIIIQPIFMNYSNMFAGYIRMKIWKSN